MLQPIYTVYDISYETDVPVSRIRRWAYRRLVQPAVASNQDGVNYTEDHMRRVRMIRDYLDSIPSVEELAERIKILGDKALEIHDPYEGFDGWDNFDFDDDQIAWDDLRHPEDE